MKDNELNKDWALLSHYGEFLIRYAGTGMLTFERGQPESCEFEIGQRNDGEIILLCAFFDVHNGIVYRAEPESFEGETSEGYKITADEGFFGINYLPEVQIPEGRTWAAFNAYSLHKFRVEVSRASLRKRLRFGLTNMLFHIHDIPWQDDSNVINVPVGDPYGDVSFSISLVPDYDRISAALRTLNHVAVTCELTHTVTSDRSDGQLDGQLIEVVTDICFILSVARGSMVSLIYVDEYDDADCLLARTHLARITKPYCPWPAVAAMDISDRGVTKRFVEATYATYCRRRDDWKLNRGTIFAYLDGKVQGDFLEMRGVKLAIVLEMLKAVYLELPSASVKEFCIEEGRFRSLLPDLEKLVSAALSIAGLPEPVRKTIRSAMQGMNRTSFRQILTGLFHEIGFHPKRDEIDRFIACRNALVHRGRFYSQVATVEERKRVKPFPRPIDEYAFLVNFLDRIFLRLLGYNGPYIDHSEVGNEVRRESVIGGDRKS